MLLSYQILKNLFSSGFLSQKQLENKTCKYDINMLLNFYGCNLTELILYGCEIEDNELPKITKTEFLEISTTPNRDDLLNIVGLMIEQDLLLCMPKKQLTPYYRYSTKFLYKKVINQFTKKTIKNIESFKIGFQTEIKGIENRKSPTWLQRELKQHNIVSKTLLDDITNYSIIKWGQPIEMYDLDKIGMDIGNCTHGIIFRYSSYGESININQTKKILNNKTLVMSIQKKIIAIPGIFIPDAIKVDKNTKNIMVTCISYNSKIIKNTVKHYGEITELSKITEKGTDPYNCSLIFQRALRLLIVNTGVKNKLNVTTYNLDYRGGWFKYIKIYYSDVNKILGHIKYLNRNLYKKEILNCLLDLKFEIIDIQKNKCTVCIPPYRASDLTTSIDIIEEIAQIYKFKNFKSVLPVKSNFGLVSQEQKMIEKSRTFFIDSGFTEIYSYSITTDVKQKQIEIKNPLSLEYSNLRTNLTFNLINNYIINVNRGNKETSLFEIGRIFNLEQNTEATFIGGIFGGYKFKKNWIGDNKKIPVTWFEGKYIIKKFLNFLKTEVNWEGREININKIYHPKQTAIIYQKKKMIGVLGYIHPQFATKHKISKDLLIFEINLSKINKLDKQIKYKNFSLQPIIRRDLSYTISRKLTHENFKQKLNNILTYVDKNNIIKKIELFDVFKQKNKSYQKLGISITFQAKKNTLLNKDADKVIKKILNILNYFTF